MNLKKNLLENPKANQDFFGMGDPHNNRKDLIGFNSMFIPSI